MNKEQLLALAGQGYIPVEDSSFRVDIARMESLEADVIAVDVKNLSQYTTEARFGGGFVDYLIDKDCEDLEAAIRKVLQQMRDIEKRANMEPLRFKRVGERLLKNIDNGRMYGYEECKEGHFSIYTLDSFDRISQTGEYSCDICRTVDIDGKVYKPVYSFWLSRTVYLLDSPEGYFPKNESKERCLSDVQTDPVQQ